MERGGQGKNKVPQERGGKEVYFSFFWSELLSHSMIFGGSVSQRIKFIFLRPTFKMIKFGPMSIFQAHYPLHHLLEPGRFFSFSCILCIHSHLDLSLCELPLFLSTCPRLTCSVGCSSEKSSITLGSRDLSFFGSLHQWGPYADSVFTFSCMLTSSCQQGCEILQGRILGAWLCSKVMCLEVRLKIQDDLG